MFSCELRGFKSNSFVKHIEVDKKNTKDFVKSNLSPTESCKRKDTQQ